MIIRHGLRAVPYECYDHRDNMDMDRFLDYCKKVIKNHPKLQRKEFPIVYIWGIGSSGLSLCIYLKMMVPKEITVYINLLNKKGVKTHRVDPTMQTEYLNVFIDDFIVSGKTIYDIQNRYHYKWDMLLVSGKIGKEVADKITSFEEIHCQDID